MNAIYHCLEKQRVIVKFNNENRVYIKIKYFKRNINLRFRPYSSLRDPNNGLVTIANIFCTKLAIDAALWASADPKVHSKGTSSESREEQG